MLILLKLYIVYIWRRFKASKNDHVIEVSLYDEMDFICPYYEMTTSDYDVVYQEHYVIYQVICPADTSPALVSVQ